MLLFDEIIAENLDQGALARTGHAGYADADGFTGVGHNGLENFLGLILMMGGVGLDKRYRPAQHNPVAL